jgi:hypothetical protein
MNSNNDDHDNNKKNKKTIQFEIILCKLIFVVFMSDADDA